MWRKFFALSWLQFLPWSGGRMQPGRSFRATRTDFWWFGWKVPVAQPGTLSYPGDLAAAGRAPGEGRVSTWPRPWSPAPARHQWAGAQPGRREWPRLIRRRGWWVLRSAASRWWGPRLGVLQREEPRSRAEAAPGMVLVSTNMAAALRSAGVLLRDRRKWGCRGRRRGGDSGQLAPGSPGLGTSKERRRAAQEAARGGARGGERIRKGALHWEGREWVTWVPRGPWEAAGRGPGVTSVSWVAVSSGWISKSLSSYL